MANKMDLEVENDYEMSDSDDEYTEREKKLLKNVRKGRKRNDSSEDEEVMKFDDEDEFDENDYEEEEEDSEPEKFVSSDLEDSGKEDEIPDGRSWGDKKQMYYNTDFHDKDYGMYTEKEEEIALMEEQEALAIQKRLANELTDADFSLEAFTTTAAQQEKQHEEEKIKKVKTDLSSMTKNQKLQLLRQDSPEFEGLVKDFNDRMIESKELLTPALELLKSLDFPKHPFLDFLECRQKLILNYCTNISFYLLLKAKRVKISNHPVVKRLVQFRELISKLDDLFDYVIKPQLQVILATVNDSESEDENEGKKLRMLEELKSKVETKMQERENNTEIVEQVDKPLFSQQRSDSDESEEEQEQEEIDQTKDDGKTKREITRQIAKNKGLTATKRRELRNPRVKNRRKFTKAVKRRKGAVQPIRSKVELYGGEATGIKTHVKRSVTIK